MKGHEWPIFVGIFFAWSIYKALITKNRKILMAGIGLTAANLSGWPFYLLSEIGLAIMGLFFAGCCAQDFIKTKNRDFALYSFMFLLLGAAMGLPTLITLF